MHRKGNSETKMKIVSAAWRLFHEQGYDETTIDDIVYESNTSKGSFYHYFDSKDALLSSLSDLFDNKYDELKGTLTDEMTATDKLLYLNRELFRLVEDSVPTELLARLLSSQLVTHSEKHLLDRNRTYYKLLRTIISEGQEKGQLVTAVSVSDIMKAYAMMERALMYDWCLCSGEYSLSGYSAGILSAFLQSYVKK